METQSPNPALPGKWNPGHTSHGLRGDYSRVRPDFTLDQPLDRYSEAEHDRWRRLYARQMELMPRYAVNEFLDSIEQLDVARGIPDFARVNRMLGRLCVNAMPLLSRLYWYTIEFGLIRVPDGLRVYGAGILSSSGETVYAIDSDVPNRIAFDLERVLCTEYRIDAFQESYFVIDSFEQLFAETHKPFASLYERLRNIPPIAANAVRAADRVLHRGTIAGRTS